MSSPAMAANGRKLMAPCCAFSIFDDATICMALVIWAVLLTDLMRRRMSRVLGMITDPGSLVGLFELRRGGLQVGDQRIAEGLLLQDLTQEFRPPGGEELR